MSVNRLGFLAAAASSTVLLTAPAGAQTTGGATLLACYKKPADAAAFDRYYKDHHAPLAKTLPGLQSFTIGHLTDKDPYYMVATLTFASLDALQAALASTAGAATVGDLKNFAQAGVDVLTFAPQSA